MRSLTGAFSYCYTLTNIKIPNSVTSIGKDAFYYCYKLTSIEVAEDNQDYKSIDGNLYSKDGKTLIQYAIGKSETSFIVPDSVTRINAYALKECYSLTSVTIGDSVESIGNGAFDGCYSLTSVTIGNSVTYIGRFAFWVMNLESIYYNGLAEDWTKISISADYNELEEATIYYYVENESDLPSDNGNYWHYVDGVPTVWVKD